MFLFALQIIKAFWKKTNPHSKEKRYHSVHTNRNSYFEAICFLPCIVDLKRLSLASSAFCEAALITKPNRLGFIYRLRILNPIQ
jgi:hypothetical protein